MRGWNSTLLGQLTLPTSGICHAKLTVTERTWVFITLQYTLPILFTCLLDYQKRQINVNKINALKRVLKRTTINLWSTISLMWHQQNFPILCSNPTSRLTCSNSLTADIIWSLFRLISYFFTSQMRTQQLLKQLQCNDTAELLILIPRVSLQSLCRHSWCDTNSYTGTETWKSLISTETLVELGCQTGTHRHAYRVYSPEHKRMSLGRTVSSSQHARNHHHSLAFAWRQSLRTACIRLTLCTHTEQSTTLLIGHWQHPCLAYWSWPSVPSSNPRPCHQLATVPEQLNWRNCSQLTMS